MLEALTKNNSDAYVEIPKVRVELFTIDTTYFKYVNVIDAVFSPPRGLLQFNVKIYQT